MSPALQRGAADDDDDDDSDTASGGYVTTTISAADDDDDGDSGTASGGYVTTTISQDCCDRSLCLSAGTLIALADGTQKCVEDINYNDNLKVWNFDDGCFASANPLYIKKKEHTNKVNVLKFSDGSELRIINQHRIFNKQTGKFTYPMTDDTPIGTITFNEKGEEITLVEKYAQAGQVDFYNIITERHLNCFANGILTSCRLNNMYPIRDMKFVKDNRKLIPASSFPFVPLRWYEGLRLAEQPLQINRDGADYHGDNSVQDYALRLMRTDKRVWEKIAV